MIDAEYEQWHVELKECNDTSARLVFRRMDAVSVGAEWVIQEITAREIAHVDRAGLHIHRRAGIRAGDFLRWLHKKAVDSPSSPARSNLLRLLAECDK